MKATGNPVTAEPLMKLWVHFGLIFWMSVLAPVVAQTSSPSLTIIFTANINAALDDCGCSDSTVGGLNRVKTVVDDLRQQYPGAILLDGGDMLASYSQPELNRTVLNLLPDFQYDGMAVGDQELVEGWEFFKQAVAQLPLRLHNLTQASGAVLPDLQRTVTIRGMPVLFITSLRAFDFIEPGKLQMTPIEKVAQYPLPPVVVLHGDIAEARLLARAPQPPVVVLVGHDQQFGVFRERGTTIVAMGSEGEHVAVVQIFNVAERNVQVAFIPVDRQVIPDAVVNQVIEQFYQKINGN